MDLTPEDKELLERIINNFIRETQEWLDKPQNLFSDRAKAQKALLDMNECISHISGGNYMYDRTDEKWKPFPIAFKYYWAKYLANQQEQQKITALANKIGITNEELKDPEL